MCPYFLILVTNHDNTNFQFLHFSTHFYFQTIPCRNWSNTHECPNDHRNVYDAKGCLVALVALFNRTLLQVLLITMEKLKDLTLATNTCCQDRKNPTKTLCHCQDRKIPWRHCCHCQDRKNPTMILCHCQDRKIPQRHCRCQDRKKSHKDTVSLSGQKNATKTQCQHLLTDAAILPTPM